ncbi:indole-3-glycerol phosphate synthase [Methanobrevibacter arboriphilus]|jgi:indole-3-glycerol phosphate synthase|uniref:Indole-3-glycerol phosphate synthase n=1 Tax=Methanobrevibacter arboriphilus TaxID=39441 RepID=A0ACA8R482_METAZ|nr:indole-3-glycerol phosphate synthase TrpC [Methanobrevibacter arboriphilus]BBL62032.1 indole-3-glycerol phosphate synthase [Methanobrevibacter arboriphilus]GLI11151.1 indole-3-glycerol phosphate synthase [Methanobrevibacter arboriphilus]
MILDEILIATEERLENKKRNMSLEDLKNKLKNKSDNEVNNKLNNKLNNNSKSNKLEDNYFEKYLKEDNISFICEVKRASPSKGIICNEFDYIKIAKEYENAGAAAISVLTEPKFFKGNDTYLSDIVANVNIPVLRKDFIIDEYMIYESKLLDASALLLITSILEPKQLKKYIKLSYSLNIFPLVETHSLNEVEIAIDSGAKIIGINNRDLRDFTVDINNTLNLEKNIPKDIRNSITIVSESGIKTSEDIKTLNDNNIDSVLIGESLMRSKNKEFAIKELKSLI